MLTRRSCVPNSRLVFILTTAVLALTLIWDIPGRSALAQTVPGGEPPDHAIPECIPPRPERPFPVTGNTLHAELTDQGTRIAMAIQIPSIAKAVSRIFCFEIDENALQHLTDRDGKLAKHHTVRVRHEAEANVPPLPSGEVRLSAVARIDLLDDTSTVINRPNFDPPAVICYRPIPAQVTAAGGIDKILVKSFDSLDAQWQTLPSSVIEGQICASVTHLSLFALTTTQSAPVPAALPNTAVADGLPTDLLMVLAALLCLGGLQLRSSSGVRSRQ